MPIKRRQMASPDPARSRIAAMPIAGQGRTRDSRLSVQQQAVLDWVEEGSGSAFVEAVAGSGKTTTLVEACHLMRGSVALAAFNKKIADEIKMKVGDSPVRVGTFHSFGFGAWRRAASNVRVDADTKWKRMMEENAVPFALRSATGKLVSLAKQSVVGVEWDLENAEVWESIINHFAILLLVDDTGESDESIIDHLTDCAMRCTRWSRDCGQTLVDFDDMLWLPLVEGVPIWQNDWVLVDEAQDTNAARRLLAARMLKKGGRSVWVGDRHQAIYGFTGADSDAVDLIVRDFGCTPLPLTVTFRCSQAATAFAQQWVPHITAHESNEPGSVRRATAAQFRRMWIRDDQDSAEMLQPGDAVLCRMTRPLVSLAFELIRSGVGCHVEGRDIGKSLDRLASKWKVDTARALLVNLEAYRQREIDRLVARDAMNLIEPVNDRVDTLVVITEGCDTVEQVRSRIAELFDDTNGGARRTVTLSTVHKAKGREWDRVFVLGYGTYMPSKRAKQAWERQQEANLMYVAATRAKRDLVLTEALEGDRG